MEDLERVEIAPHLQYWEVADRSFLFNQCLGHMHVSTLVAWEKLREVLGVPIYVSSGFRTEATNKKKGGTEGSQHLIGRALDLHCSNRNLADLQYVSLFLRCGFRGIGRGDHWVHLDTRRGNAAFWKYIQKGRISDHAAYNIYKETTI